MKSGIFIGSLCLAFFAAVVAGLSFGATSLNLSELLSGSSSPDNHIFWNIRMPRVLLGAMVGAHFAISGVLLQTTTRNALADPGILGISGGAILCMTFYVMFDVVLLKASIEAYMLPLAYLPIVALLGGMLGAAAVFSLAWKGGISPSRFILVGVAVASFCQAVSLGLISGWGPTKVDLLWIWMAGSLYGATWDAIVFVLPWTILGTLGLLLGFQHIAMLRLGDDCGISRGLSVQRWRIFSLLLACIFAGSAVGVVGPIGFVGLVVPHLARRLMPNFLGLQFIATFLLGATLTVTADAFGRTLFAPAEISVGILTSLVGAPFLFFLVFPANIGTWLKELTHVTRKASQS